MVRHSTSLLPGLPLICRLPKCDQHRLLGKPSRCVSHPKFLLNRRLQLNVIRGRRGTHFNHCGAHTCRARPHSPHLTDSAKPTSKSTCLLSSVYIRVLIWYVDHSGCLRLLFRPISVFQSSCPHCSPLSYQERAFQDLRHQSHHRTQCHLSLPQRRKPLQVVTTCQCATKLLNSDGSPSNFDSGAQAVMRPAPGTTNMVPCWG